MVIEAESSGYLNYVDHRALVKLAASNGAFLTVLHPLGTYVVPKQPLIVVDADSKTHDLDWKRKVLGHFTIVWRRSMEQDITFGIRQLVDIGEKALSPGVNDPTTAIQVMNQLHSILHRLIVTGQVPTVLRDEQGVPRVITSEWTFDQYLDLCVDEIAHWGAPGLQIPARLDQMLTQLEQIAEPAQKDRLQIKRVSANALARAARPGT